LLHFSYYHVFLIWLLPSHRRGSGSETIEVGKGEKLEVSVFTRAVTGATFTLTNAASKTSYIENVLVKHEGTENAGDEEKPTNVIINPNEPILGPVTVKVKAESKGSRFSSYDFLIVYSFKK
jgi:hypothetical protein